MMLLDEMVSQTLWQPLTGTQTVAHKYIDRKKPDSTRQECSFHPKNFELNLNKIAQPLAKVTVPPS
jgi:methionine-rich copper-binding protein CopC